MLVSPTSRARGRSVLGDTHHKSQPTQALCCRCSHAEWGMKGTHPGSRNALFADLARGTRGARYTLGGKGSGQCGVELTLQEEAQDDMCTFTEPRASLKLPKGSPGATLRCLPWERQPAWATKGTSLLKNAHVSETSPAGTVAVSKRQEPPTCPLTDKQVGKLGPTVPWDLLRRDEERCPASPHNAVRRESSRAQRPPAE